MGISIGGIIDKAKVAIGVKKKPLSQEEAWRKEEDERIKELAHRERMLSAEDIAKARVNAEIAQARRVPKAQQVRPAATQPVKKENWGARGLNNLGLGGGGGGSGLMGDLAGFGNPPGKGVVQNGKGSRPQRNSFMDGLGGGSGGGGNQFMDSLGGFGGLGKNRTQPTQHRHHKKNKGR